MPVYARDVVGIGGGRFKRYRVIVYQLVRRQRDGMPYWLCLRGEGPVRYGPVTLRKSIKSDPTYLPGVRNNDRLTVGDVRHLTGANFKVDTDPRILADYLEERE